MKLSTSGERIRETRKAAGLTQKQLAERLGVTPQNISQYERNLKSPTTRTLVKIAVALDCNVAELIPDNGWTDADILAYRSRIKPIGNYHALKKAFYMLNETGQEVAVQRVKELGKIPEYQAEREPGDDGR